MGNLRELATAGSSGHGDDGEEGRERVEGGAMDELGFH
jgi:hypothetical protein